MVETEQDEFMGEKLKTSRVALVALPSPQAGSVNPASEDAQLIAALMGSSRLGFAALQLDCTEDLAGQVEDALAPLEPPHELLLFVSARTTAIGGEVVLILDESAPDLVDSLSDVMLALLDKQAALPPLILLDLRCSRDEVPADLARLALTAGQVDGVVVIAFVGFGDGAQPSPLTAALLSEIAAAGVAAMTADDLVFNLRRRFAGASNGALACSAPPDGFVFLPKVVAAPAEHSEPEESDGGEVRITLSGRDTVVEAPAAVIPDPPASRRAGSQSAVEEALSLASEGADEAALAKLRKALSLVGPKTSGASAENSERALIHLRVGELFVRQGRAKEAIASLEKALEVDPNLQEAQQVLRMLHTLHTNVGDRRAVNLVEERLLANLTSDAERAGLLVLFGQSWLRDFSDPLRARERLEHAVTLEPFDRHALELLVELAENERRVEDSLELRKRLAQTIQEPSQRASRFNALAEEMIDRKREDEALDLLERALDAHPGTLQPLARLSALLSERQEWAELEGAYRRMLDRAVLLEDAELSARLQHELHRRLAILLSEHLEDHAGALAEAEIAVSLAPADEGSLRTLAQVAEQSGAFATMERALCDVIALNPRDLSVHRRLFDAFVKQDRVERAYAAASVLMSEGAAGDRERAILGASREELSARPVGSLPVGDHDALRRSLVPASDSSGIDRTARVFRAADRSLAKALCGLAQRAGRLAPLSESSRVDPESSTVSAARSLVWAARALSAALPAVYLEDASEEGMTAVLREQPVTVVGAQALRGKSLAELSFLAGWNIAGHMPEHRLVRLSSSVDDLAACFITAVRRVAPDTVAPPALSSLVDLLSPAFSREVREAEDSELEAAVFAFDQGGGRVDLAEYARAVDRACLRAGLLLAGDLEAARRCLPFLSKGALSLAEREAELIAFTVSGIAAELRDRLSVA